MPLFLFGEKQKRRKKKSLERMLEKQARNACFFVRKTICLQKDLLYGIIYKIVERCILLEVLNMSEIINAQIAFTKLQIKKLTDSVISDDRAFSHVLLKNIFDVDYSDQIDLVTDGPGDGGIDFLYYDEEDNKLSLCQSKYQSSLSFDEIIAEYNKMYSTVQNFRRAHTGAYNERVKKALQNALDRLPEESPDNIEYVMFTTAPVNIDAAMRKITNSEHDFSSDAVAIYISDDIDKYIQRAQETLQTVKQETIKIDKPKNYLEYESKTLRGIFCNVLSSSIVQLYDKYAGAGLFDLNIRRYIKNTLVDGGIKRTLDKERENFWFLNNGIIIACTEFEPDGDTIRLTDFSIVNGGQTTQLIGTYKGTNTQEFYIPCKIVETKNDDKASELFTKIAEATNSQKPIYPRDLKSNTPEMLRLAKWLEQENIYLEIKRGYKPSRKYSHTIKNDELGQLILSFVYQQPGTARYGKGTIFNPGNYDKIYKANYEKDINKKGFLIDLIKLNDLYKDVEKKYKKGGLDSTQTEILKAGKQIIFAVMGLCYRIINNDISENDLLNSPKTVSQVPFEYGKHLSNYHEDDFEKKLERLIKDIIILVTDSYNSAFRNGQTTSISHYLKTDTRYYNETVAHFPQALDTLFGEDLKKCMVIFKRK